MNKDDIIRMAREAGAAFPSVGIWHRFDSPEELERFANLAVAAEREEIAKLADASVNADQYPTLKMLTNIRR